MEILWAPWRMAYVMGPKADRCIFCDIQPGADGFTLYVGAFSMVIMNRFPYTNGHLLVAPRRHVAELGELTPEEMGDLIRTVSLSVEGLKKAVHPHGLNVGLNLGEVAGAGISQHLHFHVVPRWQGDANFMTVVGDARVISEDLEATYGRLKPFFDTAVASEA